MRSTRAFMRCRAEILDVMRVFGYKLLAFMEEVTNQSENHLKELAESKARSTSSVACCNVACCMATTGRRVEGPSTAVVYLRHPFEHVRTVY
jgi:hypothetical protein